MKILICGGRDFSDMEAVAQEFDWFPKGTIIVHGGCRVPDNPGPRWKPRGADAFAHYLAMAFEFDVHMYPADFATHGRAAGPMRNQAMLDNEKPDLVIAFPGGRGTADMVRRAKAAGVPVKECLSISVRPREIAKA